MRTNHVSIGVVLSTLLLAWHLSGCAAIHTSISKRELSVRSTMSDAIFLSPAPKGKGWVYVKVRNTTDKPELELEERVKAALLSKGLRITQHPHKGYYTLEAQVLRVEKTTARDDARRHYGGYGGAIGSGVAGAVIGRGAGYRGAFYGMGIGALVGGVASTVANAVVKDVVYVTITDVQIGERVDADVATAFSATLKQGSGGSVSQRFDRKARRLYHRSRIVTVANKVNLTFDEAAPMIVSGLTSNLAGIF